MKRLHFSILVLTLSLLAGCHALMSLNPVAHNSEDALAIGSHKEFIMSIEGHNDIRLVVCYDETNRCYRIDAGDKVGYFKGIVRTLQNGRFWVSITVDEEHLKKCIRQLTEVEGGFVTIIYLNVVLEMDDNGYEILLLQRNQAILSESHIVKLPFDVMLDKGASQGSMLFRRVGRIVVKSNSIKQN